MSHADVRSGAKRRESSWVQTVGSSTSGSTTTFVVGRLTTAGAVGRIVVGGAAAGKTEFALVRLNPSGSLDSGFRHRRAEQQ